MDRRCPYNRQIVLGPAGGCGGFSLIEVLVALALAAMIAVYAGIKTGDMDMEDKFYQTCNRMEEIKAALIGKPGLYCNGVPQFTGYVSDTGNLPNLYYTGEEGETHAASRTDSVTITALEGENGLAACLKQGIRPQPKALWAKPAGIPQWQYHEEGKIWAGWRGPYMTRDRLVDAWGNPFLFIVGEVVGNNKKTYRCRKTFDATKDSRDPWQDPIRWEVILDNGAANARTWLPPGSEHDYESRSDDGGKEHKSIQETYHSDFLTVLSLGADNQPGGTGVNKDISMVIESNEYLGEVAGNCGDSQALTADRVCLVFPDYTEDGDPDKGIMEICIPDSSNKRLNDNSLDYYVGTEYDPSQRVGILKVGYYFINETEFNGVDFASTGINFRFGASDSVISRRTYDCADCPQNEMAGCTCTKYDIKSHCYLNPGVDADLLFKCDEWGTFLNENFGVLDFDLSGTDETTGRPWEFRCTCTNKGQVPCRDAICVDSFEFKEGEGRSGTDDFVCTNEEFLGGKSVITCEDTPTDCRKWLCDEPPPGCDCEETVSRDFYDDPAEYANANWQKLDIPIGIRTIKAGSIYYTIPVSQGGNWVGTICD